MLRIDDHVIQKASATYQMFRMNNLLSTEPVVPVICWGSNTCYLTEADGRSDGFLYLALYKQHKPIQYAL